MLPLTAEAAREGLKRCDKNSLSYPAQLSVVCTVAPVGQFFPPPLAASLGPAGGLSVTPGSPAAVSAPATTPQVSDAEFSQENFSKFRSLKS